MGGREKTARWNKNRAHHMKNEWQYSEMIENSSSLKVHLHFTSISKFSFPLTIKVGDDIGIDLFAQQNLNHVQFTSSFHWSINMFWIWWIKAPFAGSSHTNRQQCSVERFIQHTLRHGWKLWLRFVVVKWGNQETLSSGRLQTVLGKARAEQGTDFAKDR